MKKRIVIYGLSIKDMKIYHILLLFWIFPFYSSPIAAAPVLHLTFHMGIGTSEDFFVGGTIENKGDEGVYQGFIVVTPLNKECYPQKPRLWEFGLINASEKIEFKIPMGNQLHGYKMDVVHGVDSFGNKVLIIDETADILESKKDVYIHKCLKVRNN
ncbi:hypothetical protein [Aeromonas veronii]|uniref:hypothetical protein n=1 Tax=Aeromonas veronii TaxID=654 RepID=UPI000D7751AD